MHNLVRDPPASMICVWGWGAASSFSGQSVDKGEPSPQPRQRQEDLFRPDPKRKTTDCPGEEAGGGRGCSAEETVSGAQARHPVLPPLRNGWQRLRKKDLGEKRGPVGTQAQHHFPPTPPKSEGRAGEESLAGWVPSPVLSLNLRTPGPSRQRRAGAKTPTPPVLPPPSSVPAPRACPAQPVLPNRAGAEACPAAPRTSGPALHPFPPSQSLSPSSDPTPPKPSSFNLLLADSSETSEEGSLPTSPAGPAPRAAASGTTAARSPGAGSRRSRRGSSRGRSTPCAPATGSPGGRASRPAAPARRPKAAGRAPPRPPPAPGACFARGSSQPAAYRRARSGAGGGRGGARSHVPHLRPPAPFWLRASARSGGALGPEGRQCLLATGPRRGWGWAGGEPEVRPSGERDPEPPAPVLKGRGPRLCARPAALSSPVRLLPRPGRSVRGCGQSGTQGNSRTAREPRRSLCGA